MDEQTSDPQLPQNATPAQIFVAHKMMGLSDLDAAIKARDSLRKQADFRGALRDATDLAVGLGKTPLTGDAYRAQLMKEADQPLADAQMRAQTGYAQALADPGHPANRALQSMLGKVMPTLPPNVLNRLTVNHMDTLGPQFKSLGDQAKTMAEANAVNLKAPAEAGKTVAETQHIAGLTPAEIAAKEAEAKKTGAEAGRIAALTPAEKAEKLAGARKVGAEAAGLEAAVPSAGPLAAAGVKLKEQEARKVGAEAGKVEQETGPQVAPGWVRTGGQPVDEATAKDFRGKVESTQKINENIDEILGILGNKNIITSPMERAKVQPRLSQITKGLAHETGQRGLPQQDIEFFGQMTGDPTKFSLANITGLSEAATRLKTLKAMANEDLSRHAQTHGIAPVGGAQAKPAGEKRVPVISKDGKPGTVPASQLEAAIKQGFRRG